MGESKRRSYTKEQRAAAVADVPALGVIEAAKKHGVPQSCLSRWAKDAGVRRDGEAAPLAPGASAPEQKPVKPARKPTKRASRPVVETKAEATSNPGPEEPAVTVTPEAAVPPARRTLQVRVAKLYTPSQKAVVLEDAAKDGVTAASNKHSVSRFAIYAWQRKIAKAAEGECPSPTSGPSPCEIAEQRDKEVLDEWRRHPGLGPSQIRNQRNPSAKGVAVLP